MKPCDCKDQYMANQLDHQNLTINNNSIEVKPSVVILTIGPCQVKINQNIFKQFAKWYLEDQDYLKEENSNEL